MMASSRLARGSLRGACAHRRSTTFAAAPARRGAYWVAGGGAAAVVSVAVAVRQGSGGESASSLVESLLAASPLSLCDGVRTFDEMGREEKAAKSKALKTKRGAERDIFYSSTTRFGTTALTCVVS